MFVTKTKRKMPINPRLNINDGQLTSLPRLCANKKTIHDTENFYKLFETHKQLSRIYNKFLPLSGAEIIFFSFLTQVDFYSRLFREHAFSFTQ